MARAGWCRQAYLDLDFVVDVLVGHFGGLSVVALGEVRWCGLRPERGVSLEVRGWRNARDVAEIWAATREDPGKSGGP